MDLVRASHLYKVFGKHERQVIERLKAGESREELASLGTAAVIDVSFEVAKGETFVVMGLSGSGKSTLIRMINGLWFPSEGTVEVAGKVVSDMNDAQLRALRRDHVSMVFQHFALLPHLTVRENAAYGLKLQGKLKQKERLEKANEWLNTVGLNGWGDKYPHQLSGGMQQRVGLARALAAETDILLMDEAFSALDPLIRREMQDQLLELQGALNKTIIFITHDLNEAMYLGDHIAVMRNGRVAQIGTSDEILTQPADDYVADFVQDVDRSRVLTASAVMRPTEAVVSRSAEPRRVQRILDQREWAGVFVVDEHRRLLGTVGDQEVIEAARRGDRSIANAVETSGILTARTDTPLSEFFAPTSNARVPLAVVDEDFHLMGVISRVTLLDAMSRARDEAGEGSVMSLENTGKLPIIRDTDTGNPVGLPPADQIAMIEKEA